MVSNFMVRMLKGNGKRTWDVLAWREWQRIGWKACITSKKTESSHIITVMHIAICCIDCFCHTVRHWICLLGCEVKEDMDCWGLMELDPLVNGKSWSIILVFHVNTVTFQLNELVYVLSYRMSLFFIWSGRVLVVGSISLVEIAWCYLILIGIQKMISSR